MSQHTPGPWIVYQFAGIDTEDGDAETAIMAYADENGEEGATLATVNRWSYGDSPPTEESEANAHLLAAAPDLLKACKAIRESELKGTDPANALIAVAEAIKKAEGHHAK